MYFTRCAVTLLFLTHELPLAQTTEETNNTKINLRIILFKSLTQTDKQICFNLEFIEKLNTS